MQGQGRRKKPGSKARRGGIGSIRETEIPQFCSTSTDRFHVEVADAHRSSEPPDPTTEERRRPSTKNKQRTADPINGDSILYPPFAIASLLIRVVTHRTLPNTTSHSSSIIMHRHVPMRRALPIGCLMWFGVLILCARTSNAFVAVSPVGSLEGGGGGGGGAVANDNNNNNNHDNHHILQSPLSLDFEELTEALQRGMGRSRAVWECYRMGIDPLWYYDPNIPESQLDASVHALLMDTNNPRRKVWSRDDLRGLFRSRRKTQGLGKHALESLQRIGGPHVQAPASSSAAIEESIATISHISVASDGTTKLLVKLLQDGLQVETVIIPWTETGRSTLCVSSQVGCAQACRFCATGRMGRLRNLSSGEICAQVFLARKVCRVLDLHPVDGVVFMGMGEPA